MNTLSLTSDLANALRAHGFVGRVVEPDHADYDDARAIFNGAIDRRPSAVAYATDTDDVAAAVRAATAIGFPFTVRGGSHSISGQSLRDGALCLDLRALNTVSVDPSTRAVRVGGGTLLSELDAATQAHGLAVPAGQISHTGVGGLTLGGGVGWVMRAHGLTIDSLRAAEVVLADGRVVRASENAYADLFWALRGGGGDFGIVTEFEFQAHQVGPTVLAGMFLYPWDAAPAALAASRELIESAPDELMIFDVLLTAPPEPPFPPELQGQRVAAVSVAWVGDLDEGERILAPLREAHPPALDLVEPMPYVALQSMLDATAPPGLRYYTKLHYLDEVSDAYLDTMMQAFETVPTPQSHVVTGWMGAAVDQVAHGATAFGHRGAGAFAWIIGCSGAEPLQATAQWVRSSWDATLPFASDGAYVNALDGETPVRDAYADDVWERLVAIKRRYDPDGVLAGNGIG
jgi:FAD/FMN-containing dehydrogenase